MFIPLHLSETDKHNKNPVERAINNLKAGCNKLRNVCETGVLAYHYDIMGYLCNSNNYISQASLNNCLSYEEFWGEIPYISMIPFKFWVPVYFHNWTNKSGKVLMTCSSPRRPLFLHSLSFECTSKLCINFLNQF